MIAFKKAMLALVLTTMVLICVRSGGAVALNISGTVFQDKNRNGHREARERPLPDVVISDGVHVIRSDQQGRYSLTTDNSRVLFVSLPGDHLASGEFYEYLRDHRDGDIHDFPLIKRGRGDDVSFIFFSDSHVTRKEKFNAVAGMKTAVAHMNKQKASLAVSGGDLIMDALGACESEAREQYHLYEELVSSLKLPLFNAIGNHELYGVYLEGVGDDSCIVQEEDPLYGVGLYRQFLGPDYYSFNWGPYHFVLLNTISLTRVMNAQGDTVRTYYGAVDSLQLEWLKKDLQMVPAEAPIILVGHIPFITAAHTFEGYSRYQVINHQLDDPKTESYTHVVENTPEVINELLGDRRLILALAGHHHHYEVDRWADSQHDAFFVVGGSICGQWWQGDRRIAGSTWPEGYLLVHLDDGRLEDLEYISFDWKGYKESPVLEPDDR